MVKERDISYGRNLSRFKGNNYMRRQCYETISATPSLIIMETISAAYLDTIADTGTIRYALSYEYRYRSLVDLQLCVQNHGSNLFSRSIKGNGHSQLLSVMKNAASGVTVKVLIQITFCWNRKQC